MKETRRHFGQASESLCYETMAPHQTQKTQRAGVTAAAPPSLDLAANETVVFHALLYPNRSLSNKGFIAIMGVLIGVNLLIGTVYMLLGAWPVIFFAGLDVALVWLAFKLSYRQGRLHERVIVTQNRFIILRVLPSGHESRWVLSPAWARFAVLNADSHDSQVTLSSHGKSLIIGAFLSPPERDSLAEAINGALTQVSGGALAQASAQASVESASVEPSDPF